MPTPCWKIDPLRPDPALLATAGEVVRRGGLVAFPTETVYGLGASAVDAAAVERIFQAKGRPSHNPIIVHVVDRSAARGLSAAWNERAERLAVRFWPGPLSLIVPRAAHIPDRVTAGGPTVALRCPSHPIARGLLESSGVPIAAPSANRSNRVSATTAEHVAKMLAGRIDLILDGGPCSGGLESTVVDTTCDPPRILRPGLLSAAELAAAWGDVLPEGATPAAEVLRSPGQLSRHYAPRVPLECTDDHRRRARTLSDAGRRFAWLTLSVPVEDLPGVVWSERLPSDPVAYAARLYDALHRAEEAEVERILLERPPTGDAWRAIHDRLARAAQPAEPEA